MRVLRIHNRYQQRGGEEISFESEAAVLEANGQHVRRLEFSNEHIANRSGIMGAAQTAINTIWSSDAREQVRAAIEDFKPDITHFDNTFPLVSPAVYSLCQQYNMPVVQSLRNYRLLCPNAYFFRDGQVCEDCLGKLVPLPGVIHGCYRGSRPMSGVVATMLTTHRLLRTWTRHVDRYVCLGEFARNKFIEGGLPKELLAVKPNFVDLPAPPDQHKGNDILYVGRLLPQKGYQTLVNAWSSTTGGRLLIAGEGHTYDPVKTQDAADGSLMYLGRTPEAETYQLMSKALALVVPSEWYETFGRVAVEAFANRTPVIASRISTLGEIVEDGRTGLLFEPGNTEELAAKIQWALNHPAEMRQMGENARREYEAKYTPERNYEMLMDIYEQAIDHARDRR